MELNGRRLASREAGTASREGRGLWVVVPCRIGAWGPLGKHRICNRLLNRWGRTWCDPAPWWGGHTRGCRPAINTNMSHAKTFPNEICALEENLCSIGCDALTRDFRLGSLRWDRERGNFTCRCPRLPRSRVRLVVMLSGVCSCFPLSVRR